MRVVQPKWVKHGSGSPIYSIDVQPSTNTRFATGGLNCQIHIWSMELLHNAHKEQHVTESDAALSTLTNHQGPVNIVRWSPNGLMLASGSDDCTVMVWKQTPGSRRRGNIDNSDGTESWRCFQCFRQASQNVLDLAWSNDGGKLAACSIDNCVYIWDMVANVHIKTLKGHDGPVKGICWDPVGKFLASQGGDKRLIIWQSETWSQEATVIEPFENFTNMETLMFNRISWMSDGQTLIASNCENKGLNVASCISRKNNNQPFKRTEDFVGHQGPITCTRANPIIFEKRMDPDGSQVAKVSRVAVGCNDSSLSIWETGANRPMVVVNQLFDEERGIMDITWCGDGMELLACSQDGSVAYISFSELELGRVLSLEEKAKLFSNLYGETFLDTVFAESPMLINLERGMPKAHNPPQGDNARVSSSTSNPTSAPSKALLSPLSKASSAPLPSSAATRPSLPQVETRTREGKRRVTPQLVRAIYLEPPNPFQPERASATPVENRATIIPSVVQDKTHHQPTAAESSVTAEHTKVSKRRRESENVTSAQPSNGPSQPEAQQKKLCSNASSYLALLPIELPINRKLSAPLGPNATVVAVNGKSRSEDNKLFRLSNVETRWTVYLPERTVAIASSGKVVVVGGECGSISTFTPTGNRILPPLMTGSPLAMLRVKDFNVIALTSSRMLYCWQLDKLAAVHPPIDMSPILATKLGGSVLDITVADGTPVVTMSVGPNSAQALRGPARIYSYHDKLKAWLEIGNAESASFQLSDYGSSCSTTLEDRSGGKRPLASALFALRGVQNVAPHAAATALLASSPDARISATQDHVGLQIASAAALGSEAEFADWMVCHCRLLAKKGLVTELRSLCDKLLVGRVEALDSLAIPKEPWPPISQFPQINQLELLERVLLAVATTNRSLQRFIEEYQEAVRLANG